MIIQKINNPNIDGAFEMAYKYFSILSVINDMGLVNRDIQLLAYAISQKKVVSEIKKEFAEKFNSSMPTIGNIISKLYRLNVLKKDKRLVSVNPALLIDFKQDLGLQIILKHINDDGNKG